MFFPFQLAVEMNAQSLLQYKQLAELQDARMEREREKICLESELMVVKRYMWLYLFVSTSDYNCLVITYRKFCSTYECSFSRKREGHMKTIKKVLRRRECMKEGWREGGSENPLTYHTTMRYCVGGIVMCVKVGRDDNVLFSPYTRRLS